MNHSQKIITKCDGTITNCDSLVYYKVRWTVITNCDSFFITKCANVYYKLRQVLQSAMIITNCDSTHVRVCKRTQHVTSNNVLGVVSQQCCVRLHGALLTPKNTFQIKEYWINTRDLLKNTI